MRPKPKGFGTQVEVDFRERLTGIFYVLRSGCRWEMKPHDLPPYTIVFRSQPLCSARSALHEPELPKSIVESSEPQLNGMTSG
ncbi:transposase [Vacuolonema iberomarrocanum]|uniref:transposase n=1 Tax=Vacuolonema iberomarrocanum TaxID=3454632 RepID=UPI003F6E0960